MIKNVPRNYSNDLDRRRQGLDAIAENLLPDVETTDAGKIMKVGEDGKWHLGSDENTIIVPNPDEQPTVDLEKLQIGSTVYSVKNPELTSIKSFKLTMSNGGQYNTNKPIIEFYNEGGQKAAITSSDYTVECDKTYAGNAGMDQVCSISTPDTPGTFTYTFVNDFDIEEYKLIKLTRGGTFLNDIAKNIKLELSADGENYITIYDETTITWSDTVPYHLINLKDGSEASTLLPIVTSADNGKLLEVIDGAWGVGDDLFRLGNTYKLPYNYFMAQSPLTAGSSTFPQGGLDCHLPVLTKYIDIPNVTAIQFNSGAKVNIRSLDGSIIINGALFSDVFDILTKYSNIGADYVNLMLKAKPDYSLATNDKILFMSFIGAEITFTNFWT